MNDKHVSRRTPLSADTEFSSISIVRGTLVKRLKTRKSNESFDEDERLERKHFNTNFEKNLERKIYKKYTHTEVTKRRWLTFDRTHPKRNETVRCNANCVLDEKILQVRCGYVAFCRFCGGG